MRIIDISVMLTAAIKSKNRAVVSFWNYREMQNVLVLTAFSSLNVLHCIRRVGKRKCCRCSNKLLLGSCNHQQVSAAAASPLSARLAPRPWTDALPTDTQLVSREDRILRGTLWGSRRGASKNVLMIPYDYYTSDWLGLENDLPAKNRNNILF